MHGEDGRGGDTADGGVQCMGRREGEGIQLMVECSAWGGGKLRLVKGYLHLYSTA